MDEVHDARERRLLQTQCVLDFFAIIDILAAFYGIQSHQCMEMTPSLACANKCVFCWRHHKNPVGTEWKWKVDAPEELLEEAVKNHYSMVKQMKGVPGVSKERLEEAFSIQHCALSLVGEPIT
jgi:tRNA wybutosine-synthesizing protein 1